MKIAICLAALAAVLGTCTNSNSTVVMTNQTIEYQIERNKYVVVIVEDEGVSLAQAKKYARQRAAEITVENGGRYFTIDSEQETQVIKSDRPWPDNQAFYQNMYQELIIEGDFNRERLQRRSVPSENMYPAYRMVFQIHSDKPRGRSVDACSLTDCSK
jgi:hypothetical protein